jgi:hypothetical protein
VINFAAWAKSAVEASLVVVYCLGLLEFLVVYIITESRLQGVSIRLEHHRQVFGLWRASQRKYKQDYEFWSGSGSPGFTAVIEELDKKHPVVAEEVRRLLAESRKADYKGLGEDHINAMGEAPLSESADNYHRELAADLERQAVDLAAKYGLSPAPAPKKPRTPQAARIYERLALGAFLLLTVLGCLALDNFVPSGGFQVIPVEVIKWWHPPLGAILIVAATMVLWILFGSVWGVSWWLVTNGLAIAVTLTMKFIGWLTARSTVRYAFRVVFFLSLGFETLQRGQALFVE